MRDVGATPKSAKTGAKKEKKKGPPQSAKFAYGTTAEMPEPPLKPKPKKPKLDEDNLSQSDRALNFTATVSGFPLYVI